MVGPDLRLEEGAGRHDGAGSRARRAARARVRRLRRGVQRARACSPRCWRSRCCPTLGEQGTAALVGVVFLLWVPVLPRWLARAPEIRLRFAEGARAEEWPRAVVWGGVEEPVEVRAHGARRARRVRTRRFRLALADGTVIDVSRDEPDGRVAHRPGGRRADSTRSLTPISRTVSYVALLTEARGSEFPRTTGIDARARRAHPGSASDRAPTSPERRSDGRIGWMSDHREHEAGSVSECRHVHEGRVRARLVRHPPRLRAVRRSRAARRSSDRHLVARDPPRGLTEAGAGRERASGDSRAASGLTLPR